MALHQLLRSACDTTASGSYDYVTQNAAGCDSTATLNLTINSTSSSTTTVTACDTYDWNGTTYTASGSYDYVTQNAAGCDSTATLNLTINSTSSSTTTVTACDYTASMIGKMALLKLQY